MLAHESWRALGTSVHLFVTDGDQLPRARVAVERVLERVDLTCSRFRPDSELARVNARSGATVGISPLLAEFLEAGLRGARLSDGLVDPTVGRAMRAVGYDKDFSLIRDRSDPITIRLEPIPGWQAITLDARGMTVRVAKGVEIDLGSTGKALAADLAAVAAHAAAGPGSGVLVSLGGDIAMAGEPPRGGWRVLVSEDCDTPPSADGEVIALHDGAVATSSTTVRTWHRGEIAVHHLIDPRTGSSARSPWRTATVIAGSCLDANIAATAAIIRGDSAGEWVEGLGLQARLVATDGTVRRLGGWPQPAAAA